jgi:formylglycine-generating enzyme required for sulfatase activity
MSGIFLSHSSANNAEALAIRDWLKKQGWDDVFLDLDPERGLTAGDHWQTALKTAVARCELVVVLVSPEWAASSWCKTEFLLAKLGNNPKAILPAMVAPTPLSALPTEMTAEYQQVDLTAGKRSVILDVALPGGGTTTVAFTEEGLRRLRAGIIRFRVDPSNFEWPPANDPDRAPYRGLKALEADDAGIFFGRDAPVIEALGRLREMREASPPRLLAILGASGAGKSSFLRAGLLAHLRRDDRHFLPLPIIRPDRAVISCETGFLAALEGACRVGGLTKTRADLRAAIEAGAAGLRPLLQALADKAAQPPDQGVKDAQSKPPMLVLSIDQGEELFLAEGQREAEPFLAILRELLTQDAPALTALFAIRSDHYERMQVAKALEGVGQETLGLSPMPRGAYVEVIKGPLERLKQTSRALKIEESLVAQLLADIEDGASKDALPLLAFILERLYVEYGAGGNLQLSQYRELGGIHGSIEAAVERALAAADANPAIPKDRAARLALLRRGMIPWIAGIDPDTGAPRRRVARTSEIPPEAAPLIQLLVEERLLATDTDITKDAKTGLESPVVTIEPAHEALLRQWDDLQIWLTEDKELLIFMDSVKQAAHDWEKNKRGVAWLTHRADRLKAAEQLIERQDLAAGLDPRDREYLTACGNAEAAARRRTRRMLDIVGALAFCVVVGAFGWLNQSYLKERFHFFTVVRPFMMKQVRPYVLAAEAERALKPGASFRECSKDTSCPEMIVARAGEFTMGSPAAEQGRYPNESPQHKVTIAAPFVVSKFDVTFDDWDACVSVGGCPDVDDLTYGRGTKPLINVTWAQAQQYVAWLAEMTGQPYRLLTEAEWEYAARAGATTAYSWGDEVGQGKANCDGCGSKWDKVETSPVGSFPPNAFGLYDTAGEVWQWVQDCAHNDYQGAPTDGSEWTRGDCAEHIVRGGSWLVTPQFLRSAVRVGVPVEDHNSDLGFRVARTLAP